MTPVIQALPRMAGTIAGVPADLDLADDPAIERRADDGRMGHRVADAHQTAGVERGDPRGQPGAGRRTVEPAGRDDDRVLRHLARRRATARRSGRCSRPRSPGSRDGRTAAARAPPRGSARRRATGRAPPRAPARTRARPRRRSRTTCPERDVDGDRARARRPRAAHRAGRRSTARSSARPTRPCRPGSRR